MGALLAVVAGAVFLSGCDGFLVPAGEGEPRASKSAAVPAPAATGTGGLARPTAPGAAVPPVGGTYSPPAPRDCYAGVRVEMGPIQPVMMHRLALLTLTNCGKEPYKLSGRPSVKAYAADGTAVDIEVNVKEAGKKAAAVVMLEPGGVAYSRLDWQPYDGVEKARALEIAAGPGHHAYSFPLEKDVEMVDAFDVTPWALTRPE